MREVLYQGKRVDNGEWVEGFLLKGNRTYIVTSDAIDYMVVSLSGMASVQLVEVDPETVGQFTGHRIQLPGVPELQKVFENNIVECRVLRVEFDYEHPRLDFDRGTFTLPETKTWVRRNGVVKWCDDLLEFRIHFYNDNGTFDRRLSYHDHHVGITTVIGNIFDNPELLGVTTEKE